MNDVVYLFIHGMPETTPICDPRDPKDPMGVEIRHGSQARLSSVRLQSDEPERANSARKIGYLGSVQPYRDGSLSNIQWYCKLPTVIRSFARLHIQYYYVRTVYR